MQAGDVIATFADTRELVKAILPGIACWSRLLASGPLYSGALRALILPALGEIQQRPGKVPAAIARNSGEPVTAILVQLWKHAINTPGPLATDSDKMRSGIHVISPSG